VSISFRHAVQVRRACLHGQVQLCLCIVGLGWMERARGSAALLPGRHQRKVGSAQNVMFPFSAYEFQRFRRISVTVRLVHLAHRLTTSPYHSLYRSFPFVLSAFPRSLNMEALGDRGASESSYLVILDEFRALAESLSQRGPI